jgi:hypothetical protein
LAVIARPAVVLERRVCDGFRLVSIGEGVVVSSRFGDRFGVTVVPVHRPADESTITPHSAQIRDLADVGRDSLVASASLDRSLAVTSLASRTVVSRYAFEIPLWCCCAAGESTVAAGGEQGRLFCVDLRCPEAVVSMHVPGPPVTSAAYLGNQMLLATTARNCTAFDLRTGLEKHIRADPGGCIAATACPGTPFFTVLTRQQNVSVARFCSFDGQALTTFASAQIAYLTALSRPAMHTVNGVAYAAVPNEASRDFALFAMSQPKNDMWAKYRNRWAVPHGEAPVLDLAIAEDDLSMLIASVTVERLCVYQMPVG